MNSSTPFSLDIYDDLNDRNNNKKSDLSNSNSNNNNDLEIEEQTLSSQLTENKAQLSFINEQLSLDSENEEFLLIKTSLEELVQLLEGELLTIKKRKLLAQLDRTQYVDEFRVLAESSTSSSSGSGSGPSKVDPNGSQDSLITIDDDDDDDDETESIQNLVQQFNGQECSVPFRFSNGQVAYHDAILKVDDETDNSLEDLRLKAFFLYPITESMLTCPFYLKNKCKFSTENTVTCKYSHGIAISLDQIKPKQSYSIEDHQHERNSDELTCLVRNASVKLKVQTRDNRNLWSKALVVRTDEVKGQILVRLRKDQSDHWVKLDEHDLVMVDHEEEEEPDEPETRDLITQEIVPELTNSINILNPPEFGEWERYTNGIGSKLMAKMGYQLGKGLGSDGQGILNPIETVVYPTGKSLDTCFALKTESDNRKTDFKYILKEKARKLRLEAKRAKQYEQADKRLRQNGSVFQFLDDMFYGTSNPIPETPNLTKKQTKMKQLDSKSLNLSAFQVDEELRKAEQELAKIEGSHRRNANSSKADRSVVKHLEDKMNKQRRKVEELRRKQKTIGREKSHRLNKDKLTVF